jgi:hypothetical protein
MRLEGSQMQLADRWTTPGINGSRGGKIHLVTSCCLNRGLGMSVPV